MVLAESEITKDLIQPFIKDNVQPASIDVRIADKILIPFTNKKYLLITDEVEYAQMDISDYILEPGGFILASTIERVTLPNDIAALLTGRSSIGRMGLTVHATAGWIDPGFQGNITFEIKNIGFEAVKLREGDKIGQIVFEQVIGTTDGYNGRYQGAVGVEGSKLYKEVE